MMTIPLRRSTAIQIRAILVPLIIIAVVLVVFRVPLAYGEPIDIGTRRELFVDTLLIEEMDGVELRLHRPIKAARPKSPLSDRHYVTVIKEGDLFRAYWRGTDPAYTGERHTGHPGETVHYAESHDGHEWEFPNLGLHDVGGTRNNNVILAKQPPLLTNFTPFLDTREGVSSEVRFKALAGYPGPGDKRGLREKGRGLFAFYSQDGIHWKKQNEVIPYQPEWRHAFDSQNVAFWSAAEQKYVCYFRTWTEPERLRSISRTTSVDFETWTDPVAMNPNLPNEHLYTNGTQPYFRAPHIYIALPTRFVPGRGGLAVKSDANNATDILFMSTRAGSQQYDRLFTEAFIRPGMDAARWRNRANYVALNVVPTGPTEMSIYHRSGDRFTLRTDGFISAHAGASEGELLTRPLTFSGASLHLNLSTSAVGGLRVEIQDAAGAALPGFSLDECEIVYGDSVDLTVGWKSGKDVSSLNGKAVRLRFVLNECDLFSFRFQ